MAQEVEFGQGGGGKLRSFWVGMGLSVITLGIYGYFWYYLVNDELKDVGLAKGDQNLGSSNPTMSVIAILIGGMLIVPPFLSMFNYGKRVQRAQRLGGIPPEEQINPTLAFLLLFPGALLVIPAIVWYWYATKHQNAALSAVAGNPVAGGQASFANIA